MRPTSQLQCLLFSRYCIPLLLIPALCLSLANTLRAQSPVPDDFNPSVNGIVYALVAQADGKILVGGSFLKVDVEPRKFIARFNANGTLDSTFNPGASGSSVRCLMVQADGKILVSGVFTNLAGQSRNNIGRLNVDGTLDDTFNPGASAAIYAMAVQADGKILVGGVFTNLAGQSRNNIGRLNVDGTLDDTFDPGANAIVYSLAVQADGRILVGGNFTTLGGQPRDRVARLNADGTLDDTFNPGASAAVASLAVQADGKILVGGQFTSLSGQARDRIARLNADGTLDTNFNLALGTDGSVITMAVQTDGKILMGGSFTNLGGLPRSYIARLNADGTLDETFNPGANNVVGSLSVQGDGKILAGGVFSNMGGQLRNSIARLNNTDSATQTLGYDGATVTWMRSGSSPEVWRTTYEHSADGLGWAILGHGTRVPSGWELTGVSLPPGGTLRARGFVAGGEFNGSGSFVEGYYGRPILLSQPASSTNAAGTTASFRVMAGSDEALGYQWLKNGVAIVNQGNTSGANDAILSLSNVSRAAEGGYSVVLSNGFGSVTSAPAVLTVYAPVTPDSAFNPGISGGIVTEYFPHPFVNSLAVQADGKILVGGNFAILGGQPRDFIGRLNPDGTIDSTFNPGANHWVDTMAVQADGKILVGGWFSTLGGQTRYRMGRLQADGTLDNTFNPGTASDIFQNIFTSWVRAFAVQPDRKIVVGGYFAGLGTPTSISRRLHIGRLNANGTVDRAFNPGANDQVFALAMQTNGMILVGGDFTTLGRKPRSHIARVKANGAVDIKFNPGANERVLTLAVQADGKILVGGDFTTLGGQTRNFIGRLNPEGTLDTNFNPRANSSVVSLAVQADGRILVGGYFTTMAGQPRSRLARLNPDGSLDSTFNPGANDGVNCVAVQEDGNILVGGEFTTLGGQSRGYIGRLNNTEPATQTFEYAGSTITWMRGGASPEVWRTTFEQTTNGLTWTNLGSGARIAGGWRRTGLTLSPSATVRARGYVTGGEDASAWFLEDYFGKPVFTAQPASQTNGATTTATFRVAAEGSGPLLYQWFKNGVALVDQGNTAGANLATQTLSNVFRTDEGAYHVVVNNGFGSVTSAVANLTVLNPRILEQPVGAQRNAGENVTLSVTVVGVPLPSYQWYHDGTVVPGAVASSLTLQSLLATDVGDYTVVVSNTDGSVTSEPALLEVNTATVDNTPRAASRFEGTPDVRSLVVQGDGRILVGGDFDTLGGPRENIGRLNADGTVDSTFDPYADWFVFSLATQADGKIVVGGGFGSLGDQPRSAIGRLNADGTVDTTFNPGARGGDGFHFFSTDGLNGTTVYAVAAQADGKILLGGNFKIVAGQQRSRLARLNPDGTLDRTFTSGAGGASPSSVRSIVVQGDGKILVGGEFTTLGGNARKRLGRLNADGKLDTTFIPAANDTVHCVAVQADGRILVAGEFATLNTQPRNRLARLNADGTLDTSFNPGANGDVFSLLVEADGKILVGGSFTTLAGRMRRGLARLHPDGSLDINFNPVVNGIVYSLAVQQDRSILVGGAFDAVGGQSRGNIARLNHIDAAPQPAGFNGSNVIAATASRSSAGGQIGRSNVEHSVAAEAIHDLTPAINLLVVRFGSTVVLNWTGGQGPYQVQRSSDLSNPDSWQDVGAPVQTNSIALPIGTGASFLRVRGQ